MAATTLGADLFVHLGDTVRITKLSSECVGPDEFSVTGVVSGGWKYNVCTLADSTLLKLGPASATGNINLSLIHKTYGAGPAVIAGSYPSYTVYLDDGFPQYDQNDLVVRVDCCNMTGDSILDDSIVRKALRDEVAASGAYDRPVDQRLERAGYIAKTADGQYVVRHSDANEGACSVDKGSVLAGDSVVAWYHTHPWSDGELRPAACGASAGTKYEGTAYGGGSKPDWNTTDAQGVPTYKIDTRWIARLDPGTPEDQRYANRSIWFWPHRGCGWS